MNLRPHPLARRCLVVATGLALALPALGSATSPATAAPGDDVVDWAEVEDGAISGGPALNSGDHGNFSGTGSYTFRETGMTSAMTVEVPAAGTYPVHVRYAAGPLSPAENVTRSMGLVTNGTDRQQMSLPMTSFDDWETWRFVSYEVDLEAGSNTIALSCDRGVDTCRLNFDAIQVGGATPDPCVATEPGDGWRSLYDGTFASFDRWRKAGAGGFGRQTDCSIRSVRGRGATWLTETQAAPYTLELDWRRDGSDDDSAVYLASTGRGGADPVGGLRVRIGADDTGTVQLTGGASVPADAAAVAGALHPAGEWNTFTLRLTEDAVEVDLNGVLVNAVQSPTPLATDGFVGLENRSFIDTVDFRDIRIKDGVAPEATASSTALDVAPGTVRVGGDAATLTATVTGEETVPTGEVEFWVDDALAATVALGADGRARTRVGPFDTVGSHAVEARYLGSPASLPSASAASTVRVAKVRPRLRATVAPRIVKVKRTRARLVVTVSAPGVVPTGRVRVKVGRKVAVRTVRRARVALRLPRFARAGTARVRVAYLGDARTLPAATTVKVRVRRR